MMGHIEESQFNDYLDGVLSSEETPVVEAHLAACAECSAYLSELGAVVDAMGDLPLEATPARDLWSGIHARIDGQDASVVPLPLGPTRSAPRRVSMTWGQLLAAGIVLAVVSGAIVRATLVSPTVVNPATGFVSPIAAVQTATERYDEAILELEQVIEQGRDILTPATLQTLEHSIVMINDALAEARKALSEDPNSELLNRLLVNHQQAKLRVLQRTVAAMQI